MFNEANQMFASLFNDIKPVVATPIYKIRCNYRQIDGIGTASFLMPHEHTSDVNCTTTLEILRNLGEDTAMLIREYHGNRGRGMVPGSATFAAELARG